MRRDKNYLMYRLSGTGFGFDIVLLNTKNYEGITFSVSLLDTLKNRKP